MLTGEDGLRPYARDLAGGSKGLPGSAYAAGTVPPGTGSCLAARRDRHRLRAASS